MGVGGERVCGAQDVGAHNAAYAYRTNQSDPNAGIFPLTCATGTC